MGRCTGYEVIPIVNAAKRCGVTINERTLHRAEVEAKCPFCGDKSNGWHLSMNTVRNVYKCFLCGETGNSVSLYAKLQSPPISYGEAARELLAGSKLYPFPQNQQPDRAQEKGLKPIDERHEVFTAMLRHLALSDKHCGDLRERGLSIERIRRNMYRSLPADEDTRRTLARMLSDFYDLDGVPGFCKDKRGEWTIAGAPGLLIPVRDMRGRIQGIQIRLDGEEKRKYRWLSSGDKHGGTRSGAWIHVTGNTASSTAYITEGGLKGDVASYLDGDALFICFAGVNAIGGLKDVVKALGVSEIVIAGDMDKVTNWRVRNGLNNIAKAVSSIRGVRVRTGNWNAAFKGVDDYYKIRNIIQERGKQMVVLNNSISGYLHEIWRKEYPEQDTGFIDACSWEKKTVEVCELIIDYPDDGFRIDKARSILEQVKAGTALPPVICVNGYVIDGIHRCWAYKQAGVTHIRVYQNMPWSMEEAA